MPVLYLAGDVLQIRKEGPLQVIRSFTDWVTAYRLGHGSASRRAVDDFGKLVAEDTANGLRCSIAGISAGFRQNRKMLPLLSPASWRHRAGKIPHRQAFAYSRKLIACTSDRRPTGEYRLNWEGPMKTTLFAALLL